MPHWRLWGSLALTAGFVLSTALTISPANAVSYDPVTVSGTVWLDENYDGIRQPSESAVPSFRLGVAIGGVDVGDIMTDYQGRYVYSWAEIGYRFSLRPISRDAPVAVFDLFSVSYSGCAYLHVLPGDASLTRWTCGWFLLSLGMRPSTFLENWPLFDGHFFTETAVRGCESGFSVTNAGGITFWDTWQRLGFGERRAIPISHRFKWKGLVTQVFQKAAFQWRPGKGVFLVDVFDELDDAGLEDALRARWRTPVRLDASFDAGKSGKEMERDRLALLDGNEAIRERYYAAPDPLLQYGLPTSRAEDLGNVIVLRTQRALFQQWKAFTGRAGAGEVTIVNAGEIARELGLFPEDAMKAQPSGFLYPD